MSVILASIIVGGLIAVNIAMNYLSKELKIHTKIKEMAIMKNKLIRVLMVTVSIILIVGLTSQAKISDSSVSSKVVDNSPKMITKTVHDNRAIEDYEDGSWKVYDNNKGKFICHVVDGSEDGENSFDSVENMEMFYSNFYK